MAGIFLMMFIVLISFDTGIKAVEMGVLQATLNCRPVKRLYFEIIPEAYQ